MRAERGGQGGGARWIRAGGGRGDQDDDLDGDLDDDDQSEAGAEAKAAAGGAGFDPNRRLCPDGSCVGLIGADGLCNVCGQKAD